MKKKLSIWLTLLLIFSAFLVFSAKVKAWSSVSPFDVHGDMARDALEGLDWTSAEIGDIPDHANHEAYDLFYHRVNWCQQEFLYYKCGNCGQCDECNQQGTQGGAEDGAAYYIEQAKLSYDAGDIADGQKYLGYATHFIQDAVCPAHVFPFEEGLFNAHTEFEAYTALGYSIGSELSDYWQFLVENAPAETITNPDSLRGEVLQSVNEVLALPCGYIRQGDGARVGPLPPNREWYMTDGDVGKCMEKAASLVKGAALYATSAGYLHVKLFGLDDDDLAIDIYVDGNYWVTLDVYPGVYTSSGNKAVQGGLTHEVKIEWLDADDIFPHWKTQSQAIDEGEIAEFTFVVDDVTDIPSLYHTYGETVLELMITAQHYNEITHLESIGKTHYGRDIWALKISDNPQIDGEEPAVLFIGCHHAREIITVETCLYMIDELVRNYGSDSAITDIVNSREIWIIPMLDPDGHIRRENGEKHSLLQEWRKNARPIDLDGDGSPEGVGVDLNRNYGFHWGEDLIPDELIIEHCEDGCPHPDHITYWGTAPFSELETRSIRNLVLKENLALSLSWHSYKGWVLYPWGWTETSLPASDIDVFVEIANDMATASGYAPHQASDLYKVSGDSDDWLYAKQDVRAFTIEIEEIDGTGFTPPNDQDKIDNVCAKNFEAAKYLATYDVFHITAVPDETEYIQGDVSRTTVEVTNFGDDTKSFALGISYKDPEGEASEYDPQISITPSSATLAPGGKATFDVEWTIPSDVPSGPYQIAVNCWTDATFSERYVDDLFWKPIFTVVSPVDVVLVIDRSGSMSGSKINSAKASAKQFVDLMQIDDRIGVVSYSSYAGVNYQLSQITSISTKTAAKNAIGGIYASGMTAMGRGLRTALNQLLSYGDSSHPWAIVLMSNGWHNTGEHPYNVIPALKSHDIRAYTIGLGSGADGNLLGHIASQTGGFYRFAATPEDLLAIYNDIAARVGHAQTISSISSSVSQGEMTQTSVEIDSSVTQATFTISWGGSDLDLTLLKPDSTLVDPNIAATDPNIDYIEESIYEMYRIASPMAGTWTMLTTGVSVPTIGEHFVAKITALTSVTLSLTTDKDHYVYPEKVMIVATLQDWGRPLAFADVNAIISRPQASEIIVPLVDDGSVLHGDTSANDGMYTNYFDRFSEDGSYTIRVISSGMTIGGEDFLREAQKTVLISGVPSDTTPPKTSIFIDMPQYVDAAGNLYVNSSTNFVLTAVDNNGMGSGVAETSYKIHNTTYDTGWLTFVPPITFQIVGLSDGTYDIDYYSVDSVGNTEEPNNQTIILDNSSPSITVSNPPAGWALQDGVTFLGSTTDAGCGVFSMSFSIREANDGEGTPIGYEDLPVSYDPNTGEWSFSFDTLLVPDGYYVLYIEAEDNLGNEVSTTVSYSIRNWAVIELLPSSEDNKAGRTMPVKFALRVAAEVDPNQPFVYNEELRIEIFATTDPDNVLQASYYGDIARDYRISSVLYVTNFKTIKRTPMEYTVAIYRDTFDVGSFTFETVK